MSSFQSHYETATDGCAVLPLSDWSVITMSGEDRTKFLHNMCTNDIQRLRPGEGCEAFCTDVKGKIVAQVFVLVLEDHLELLTVPGLAEKIITHLDRYIIREDVVLEDVTYKYSYAIISGNDVASAFGNELDVDLSDLEKNWQSKVCRIGEHEVLVARADMIWPPSFLLRHQGSLADISSLTSCHIIGEPSVWETLRVESGLPLYETDFDAGNLPQEIARNDKAISFNKGCYLGQETVARIDALGHVNKQLCLLKFSGKEIPESGTKLLSDDKEVGEVTSACWSPRYDAVVGLAMVRRGANDVGTQLESGVGGVVVYEI